MIDQGVSQAIEAVYIPEKKRGTLCISSQIGCLIDCPFCATGHQGFNRNLSSAEIIGQVLLAKQDLQNEFKRDDLITNVVFMGMGEPLANFSETVRATKILTDPNGFNISRRRVTISTSGLVPQIRKLADHLNVSLAISLHAPFDNLRDELVPINKIHPIESLLDACWFYAKRQNLKNVTFEYTLLKNVNDRSEHAKQLAKLLKNQPAKVNLIPFNKFPDSDVLLGPEMKSTGEVMGFDDNFGMAYAKSQIAASNSLPTKGLAFLSVKDSHKKEIIDLAKKLLKLYLD